MPILNKNKPTQVFGHESFNKLLYPMEILGLVRVFALFSVILLIQSCGTQQLPQHEYVEVDKGEKSLLLTNNFEVLDPADLSYTLFVEPIFDALFGFLETENPSRKNIEVTLVDGSEVSTKLFKENQHILILPGIRKLSYICSVDYEEKGKIGKYKKNNMSHMFEGGLVYEIFVKNNDCDVGIKRNSKYRYNKPHHKDAADAAPM